jgi:alkanesulfonate monooxygenase SsuD/methylene tetrahydromethanopterin reductase-like flavin-dependent oxidoreductase (luciferase family)
VTWSGETRSSLTDQQVFPALEHGKLKTWIGVGGSPESVIRAARHGLPMMLAIIGGEPSRFTPLVDLYSRALDNYGMARLPIGVHSPGYIADTDARAKEELFPRYQQMRDKIGAERGWPPLRANEFEAEIQQGSLYVGSPETVARKIAATVKALGVERFDLKYSTGPMPHEQLMHCIELYGTKVIPMVRELLG